MGNVRRGDLADRLRDTTVTDMSALAQLVYDGVQRDTAFDFACFATTDPATGLLTWASKTRSLGIGDEEFAAAEYGPPDINSFSQIATRTPPVGVLSIDTGGRLDDCRRHRTFMAPRFGFTDELRAAFVSRGATWGALGLYRGPGDQPFTAVDAARLGETTELVAEAIQRCLFHRDPAQSQAVRVGTGGPAVLIIDADDHVTQLTPAARAAIDELGGWDHGSLPANILAVVAATRTRDDHIETQAQTSSGRWLSLRAAALAGPADRRDVVVTIELTSPAVLSRLALTAHGLTAREEDVALLVLQGASTQVIAESLFLSPHTVQDHLKKIFGKLGVTSRREMTARLVLS